MSVVVCLALVSVRWPQHVRASVRRVTTFCVGVLTFSQCGVLFSFEQLPNRLLLIWLKTSYARFTIADPMPRLASDVVGGKLGRNHPTSRRHPIHIGRMARNAYIRVGWYEGVVQYCTTPWFERWRSLIYCNSQLRCTRSAPDRPAASGNIKHV